MAKKSGGNNTFKFNSKKFSWGNIGVGALRIIGVV